MEPACPPSPQNRLVRTMAAALSPCSGSYYVKFYFLPCLVRQNQTKRFNSSFDRTNVMLLLPHPDPSGTKPLRAKSPNRSHQPSNCGSDPSGMSPLRAESPNWSSQPFNCGLGPPEIHLGLHLKVGKEEVDLWTFKEEYISDDQISIICIMRRKLLESAIKAISRVTFYWTDLPQIEFADDMGGPQREFFRSGNRQLPGSLSVQIVLEADGVTGRTGSKEAAMSHMGQEGVSVDQWAAREKCGRGSKEGRRHSDGESEETAGVEKEETAGVEAWSVSRGETAVTTAA
ncbi:hypothetical protein PAMA_005545 [Pampus argenteus]